MKRILKVFVTGADPDLAAQNVAVLERYDAFVVIEASRAAAKTLARRHLVEDITDQYRILLATWDPSRTNGCGACGAPAATPG